MTIPVCCTCHGAGSMPAGAMPVENDYGKGFTWTSQTKCPTCKGSGYGKC